MSGGGGSRGGALGGGASITEAPAWRCWGGHARWRRSVKGSSGRVGDVGVGGVEASTG
jgi:hypothetical protein